MRRLTVAVAAAAAATGPAAVPAAAVYAPTVLAVPADGRAVSTPFTTAAGAYYTVFVSGVFAYDRRGGLADCGYRDANGGLLGQDWQYGDAGLRVDGGAPWCGYYTDTHDYALRVAGTGDRLRFSIADVTGHADNAGALTVRVLAAPGAAGVVVPGCDVLGVCPAPAAPGAAPAAQDGLRRTQPLQEEQ